MRIRLCGNVAIESATGPIADSRLGGHQGRLALAFLVMHRDRAVPREELADVLWEGVLPASWPVSLSAVVSKMRRLLTDAGLDGPSALASSLGCYRLHLPDGTWVDVEAVGAAIEAGERSLRAGDPEEALRQSVVASTIAEAAFLPGAATTWVDGQRSRLRAQLVRALRCQVESHLALGDAARAIGPAAEVVGLEPFGEAGWRLLMRAHANCGERAEALRVWERCRSLLVEELGTEPDAETQALYRQLLLDEPPAEHVSGPDPASAEQSTGPLVSARPRPPIPALVGRGPFVGRDRELERLATEWDRATESPAPAVRAVFIAGEPGVGKTRLAGEWAHRAHELGALVLYGRCDEDLGAPYQPFSESLRTLVPSISPGRLASVPGVEELTRLAPPEVGDLLPRLGAPTQADPDTERYVLFDAFVRLLAAVSADTPVLLIVDDLQWAAKPTLLLLRHIIRTGVGARLLVVAPYRNTDLDRSHPLAGMLADLYRDSTTTRVTLGGLDLDAVSHYLALTGHGHLDLAPTLSTVTGGNPFFLIEVVRNVEEAGGAWDATALPEGVREVVGRRLSRLSDTANEALLVAAVAGVRFSLDLVERVVGRDLVDAIVEARDAGLVVEVADGRFHFNHAIVRQCLLAEVTSVQRTRLHRRLAEALEAGGTAAREVTTGDLAYHWFESVGAGGARKAVEFCRRAAEEAMARLAYEEAAEHCRRAVQAADYDPGAATDRARAELLVARCEALLAAGDVTAAATTVTELRHAAQGSTDLAAWAQCFAGELAAMDDPAKLATTEAELAVVADRLIAMGDGSGEAKAHTVRATCLARLGRFADCQAALDRALTASRRAGDARRANEALAAAPVAALWGPSSVTDASGQCLELAGIVLATTASPAVAAVASRCHAVLEALRGRYEEAVRILGSARRVLEGLGHTHGLLETDLFEGMVELLYGNAVAAEVPLRSAYQGFAARGVGIDAAHAAALLARAVLAQDRVGEALALTDESERLGGIDLKSAIGWRTVRAEALAREGAVDGALALALAAVALVDRTDALLDRGDAHLSLAIVNQAAGRRGAAEREVTLAVDLYERKGATTCVERVRSVVGSRGGRSRGPVSASSVRHVRPNAATTAGLTGEFEPDRVDDWADQWAHDCVVIDHRWHVTGDGDGMVNIIRSWCSIERVTIDSETLASLGTSHALKRLRVGMTGLPAGAGGPTGADASLDEGGPRAGDADVGFLRVLRTAADGRMVHVEQFPPGDLPFAAARLIELHADAELPPELRAGRFRVAAHLRDGTAEWSDDARVVDHRGDAAEPIVPPADALGVLVDVLGLSERVFLIEVQPRPGTGGRSDVSTLLLAQMGEDGCWRRADLYSPSQIAAAMAEFRTLNRRHGAHRR